MITTKILHCFLFYILVWYQKIFLTTKNNQPIAKIPLSKFCTGTLVHEIFAWVLFSRSAPARIYNPRELEWFAQLKVRKNKIARFLKDIFWFFFLSLAKYQQNTNIWDVLVWQNQTFFCRCAKIRFARKWKKWGCAKIKCAKIKLTRKFHELRYDIKIQWKRMCMWCSLCTEN